MTDKVLFKQLHVVFALTTPKKPTLHERSRALFTKMIQCSAVHLHMDKFGEIFKKYEKPQCWQYGKSQYTKVSERRRKFFIRLNTNTTSPTSMTGDKSPNAKPVQTMVEAFSTRHDKQNVLVGVYIVLLVIHTI